MSNSERRYLSEDENLFRVEYLKESAPIEDDEAVVLHHVGDTGAVVEVSGQVATKTHQARASFERERDALVYLHQQRMSGVPRLLAVNESAQRLSLERIFGANVDARGETHAVRVWEAAGQWLRSLHLLPLEAADTLSFSQTMRARLQSAYATTKRVLDDQTQAMIEAALQALQAGAYDDGQGRVFAHRDYRPRNWMLARNAQLVVVDYEHARPDFAEVDLARLVPYWRERPTLARTFLRAYEDPRLHQAEDRLRIAVLVDALKTLEWGLSHSRDDYELSGRALVEAALSDYSAETHYLHFP